MLLYIAYFYGVISGVLLMLILVKIHRFYLYRRRLEASGLQLIPMKLYHLLIICGDLSFSLQSVIKLAKFLEKTKLKLCEY
ncbi:hypothetical protein TNIN_19261 [Trichonephila inaurata madagascariensis]|uniref:Uncharacterized protein n=1 Tax=Trichonephila inaurata madagascariensis TaxID=2747483 RepID=A0A8X6XHC4_9ARAC|nr:hypothetical protein TNIN_19261 [Trichonephila inaurata madagascariensis]